MIEKKDKRKNLERHRVLFFQAGLIVSLSLVLFAFEWSTSENVPENIVPDSLLMIDDEESLITRTDDAPKPEPLRYDLTIVDDNVETDDVEIDTELKIDEIIDIEYKEPDLDDTEIVTPPEPLIWVPEMPVFPGGEEALMQYLASNIHYPQSAKEIDIQGIVYITFVVETNGTVGNIELLRGIGGGCDEEAMRVVKNMPAWSAGKQNGRPVRVRLNLPVKFVLN